MRWIFLLAASAASLFAQLAAPNESGVALGHIHLMVADPEAQKKLWVGVLGAEVTHAGTLEMLKLPGIFVIVGKARTPPTEGSEGSMVNHFGFLVKSYAETKAKLSAAGLDFATDNAATHQLMVNFPDKVKVEFTEDASLKVPLTMHHIHLSTPDMEKLRGWYVRDVRRAGGLAGGIPFGAAARRRGGFSQGGTGGGAHQGTIARSHWFRSSQFGRVLQEAAGGRRHFRYGVQGNAAARRIEVGVFDGPEGTRIELTEGLAGH